MNPILKNNTIMKKNRFLWFFLPLLAIITGLTFVACGDDDDDDDSYSTKDVVGYWSGRDGNDEYALSFNKDMSGSGYHMDSYYNEFYDFEFKWKMTGNNKGKIMPYEDGYVYDYDDEYISFEIKNKKMTIYLNYEERGYTYTEVLCVLTKEEK